MAKVEAVPFYSFWFLLQRSASISQQLDLIIELRILKYDVLFWLITIRHVPVYNAIYSCHTVSLERYCGVAFWSGLYWHKIVSVPAYWRTCENSKTLSKNISNEKFFLPYNLLFRTKIAACGLYGSGCTMYTFFLHDLI